MLKKIYNKTFIIARLLLLWISILFLAFVIIEAIKFLFPIVKNIFRLSLAPIQDIAAQTTLESAINSANFSLVYITILFTLIGIVVTIVGFWWSNEANNLKRCHKDYIKFKESFPLETRLTTAKIFFLQKKYSEAWDYIKDLPENFSYEIPLYKAGILIEQFHEKSVFSAALNFLNKALLFPGLSKESRAVIYRYISIAYFTEKEDYDKALEFAEKAITENPVFWSAHLAKGRALKRLGFSRLNEAIETLEMVIAENSTYEVAYYNLACYYSLKASNETNPTKVLKLKNLAIKHYKRSVLLNKENEIIGKDDSDLNFIRSDI